MHLGKFTEYYNNLLNIPNDFFFSTSVVTLLMSNCKYQKGKDTWLVSSKPVHSGTG